MAKIVQKSKKVSIIWSDRAKTDLQEIVHFIQQDSPDAARKLAIQFNEKISRLEFFPDSGRTLPEFPNLPSVTKQNQPFCALYP
ncbi:MAG: type II toxin-antitoxin system RelE/ParE family toxin [Nitrospirae bacterium]|nr:type II toxin-antitoxin system RelE/ParE family toxin [Nitrospirota bacterium]